MPQMAKITVWSQPHTQSIRGSKSKWTHAMSTMICHPSLPNKRYGISLSWLTNEANPGSMVRNVIARANVSAQAVNASYKKLHCVVSGSVFDHRGMFFRWVVSFNCQVCSTAFLVVGRELQRSAAIATIQTGAAERKKKKRLTNQHAIASGHITVCSKGWKKPHKSIHIPYLSGSKDDSKINWSLD